MNEQQIYDRIRLAMNEAPRNRQTAELHLQMIKYADELKPGDELISVGGNFTVESASETVFDVGLFSPMTAASNFYIFPYQSVKANDLRNEMILVHCLAEIDNPKKQ